ncbi:MAG: ABC transporter permease subunit, partial [Hungatella sp.]
IVPYNLIIARTFFESSLPEELREAAMLDGCTEFQYFAKVVMPLSGAIVAIMILFYGVAQWNTYFNALLYIKDQILYPLQLVLRNILIQNQVPADMVGDVAQAAIRAQRAELIKYVSIIVSAAPLLILYPFVQKHFVKGVMVGSVKG